MCLAIPGKVIEIKGQEALIEYPGDKRKALIGGEKIRIGDYVMVQMGIIIKIISKKEAETSYKAWSSSV